MCPALVGQQRGSHFLNWLTYCGNRAVLLTPHDVHTCRVSSELPPAALMVQQQLVVAMAGQPSAKPAVHQVVLCQGLTWMLWTSWSTHQQLGALGQEVRARQHTLAYRQHRWN